MNAKKLFFAISFASKKPIMGIAAPQKKFIVRHANNGGKSKCISSCAI